MQDRILLIMIIIICVIGPGIHYFIGGRNFDNSNVWNILVGLQIVGGLAVIFFVGRQKKANNFDDHTFFIWPEVNKSSTSPEN